MRLIWINMINAFIELHIGGRRRPVSFDAAKTCPSLQGLTRRSAAVRKEVDAILPCKTPACPSSAGCTNFRMTILGAPNSRCAASRSMPRWKCWSWCLCVAHSK